MFSLMDDGYIIGVLKGSHQTCIEYFLNNPDDLYIEAIIVKSDDITLLDILNETLDIQKYEVTRNVKSQLTYQNGKGECFTIHLINEHCCFIFRVGKEDGCLLGHLLSDRIRYETMKYKFHIDYSDIKFVVDEISNV